jgi:hypothetical protein
MSEQVSKPPYPREPQAYPGGAQEPGGPVPPYEGRQTGTEGKDVEEERGGQGSQAGPRQVSEAERGGMSDTEMSPSGPLGVGESTTTSGEDLSRGTSEASRRSDRIDTGVSREENVDPDSPAMHTGDQGS